MRKACVGGVSGWITLGSLALSLAWGCAAMGPNNPSDLPVGVVDPQRILAETVKGKRLSDALNAFMKDRQTLVELEQKELRKLESELMAQSTILSQEARDRKEEQFREKMAGYQQKVADLNREVQEKQRELQNEFRLQVQKVVSEVAGQRGLGLVLEYGVNSGTLYYQADLDISTDVIQALDREGSVMSPP
ncbi:MAG: OmpH family outer membrane protein [Nitrospirales bacterium]|nr:OmpH family outer membrane protein [Nitrospirales bacterium]MDR4482844.1 OmpH family outer membrane protein [Nitrospirales bacterium]